MVTIRKTFFASDYYCRNLFIQATGQKSRNAMAIILSHCNSSASFPIQIRAPRAILQLVRKWEYYAPTSCIVFSEIELYILIVTVIIIISSDENVFSIYSEFTFVFITMRDRSFLFRFLLSVIMHLRNILFGFYNQAAIV